MGSLLWVCTCCGFAHGNRGRRLAPRPLQAPLTPSLPGNSTTPPHPPPRPQVEYYVSPRYGQAMFNSCKDVVYSAANQRAMMYVGGGATSYQQLLDFVGTVKDERVPPVGSPYQLTFPPGTLLETCFPHYMLFPAWCTLCRNTKTSSPSRRVRAMHTPWPSL